MYDEHIARGYFNRVQGSIAIGAQGLFSRKGRELTLDLLRRALSVATDSFNERMRRENEWRIANEEFGSTSLPPSSVAESLRSRVRLLEGRISEVSRGWNDFPPDISAMLKDAGIVLDSSEVCAEMQ